MVKPKHILVLKKFQVLCQKSLAESRYPKQMYKRDCLYPPGYLVQRHLCFVEGVSYLLIILLSIPFNKLPCNNSTKAKTTTNPSHTNGNERGILLEAKKGQNGNGAASSHAEAIPTIVNENEVSCNNGVAGGQEAAKTNILGKLKKSVNSVVEFRGQEPVEIDFC